MNDYVPQSMLIQFNRYVFSVASITGRYYETVGNVRCVRFIHETRRLNSKIATNISSLWSKLFVLNFIFYIEWVRSTGNEQKVLISVLRIRNMIEYYQNILEPIVEWLGQLESHTYCGSCF